MRYIALLRGINVGGNTMIKMEELRKTFEALGFENVVSYINSGNLAFDTKKTAVEMLASKIETAIESYFGKSVQVMIREQAAISDILGNNPFHGKYESHKEMHVLFMRDRLPVDKAKVLLELQTDDERCVARGREIYCHLRLGVANSLLARGLVEKKLKIAVTARNWRTVEKLAEL